MFGKRYGNSKQRSCAVPVSVNSTCAFQTTAAPLRDEGSTGEIHTALHLQLAGLLVHREFLQIQRTGCCCGKSAKQNKKEGRNDSSLFLRILQDGEGRVRWRIDQCVWNLGKGEKER